MPVFLIPLIMQLVMNLPALIKMAEEAFSGAPGNGPAKKQLVLSGAQTIMGVVGTVSQKPIATEVQSAILGSIGLFADATVSAFNTAGLFKKAA